VATIDLSPIEAFLPCKTPQSWVERAVQEPALLLIDHANCEKKAAATAMNLMYRYVERTELLRKMSQLAREELLHFEQVVELMQELGINYSHLGPSRYASGLREHLRTHVAAHPRIVATSSEKGSGIAELRAEMASLADPAALGYKSQAN